MHPGEPSGDLVRLTRMRSATAAMATSLVLVGVAACTSSHSPGAAARGNTAVATTSRNAPANCPTGRRGPNGAVAAVDYVDFIQAYGQQYIAGLGQPDTALHVSPQDLGPIVLRSRCSYAQLNDRYGVIPPDHPRDGDTAFLPPGTPIHAVRGWSPECRLAASSNGALRLYLAYRNDTKVATPRECALRR